MQNQKYGFSSKYPPILSLLVLLHHGVKQKQLLTAHCFEELFSRIRWSSHTDSRPSF